QSVADSIRSLYEGDDALVPDPAVLAKADSVGGDQASALAVLTEVEETLAAAHLDALASIADPITAKTAAQVLAVEGQQAVALTVLADGDLTPVTPATVSPEGVAPATSTTDDSTATSEEAGN